MYQLDPQPVKKKSGCLGKIFKGILIILGLFIALIVVIAIVGPKNPDASPLQTGKVSMATTSTVLPTDTSVPSTATPEWMAESFEAICGSNSTLTEIQQEARVKKMIGKKVVGWTGKVYDVQHEGDKYTVSINMQSSFMRTRDAVISGVNEDVAVKLNVDQQVTFDGTIQDIDIAFGVICNPMTVVEATIKF